MLSNRFDADQAGVSQDAQMLRHRRLTDCEDRDELVYRGVLRSKDIENLPSMRLSNHREGIEHGQNLAAEDITVKAYVARFLRVGVDGL